MKNKPSFISLPEIAAVATWLVVFAITMHWLQDATPEIKQNSTLIVILFVIYLGCFLAIARKGVLPDSRPVKFSVIALQLFSAFSLMWLLPVSFLPILTIIWVALLTHFVSLQKSIVIMLAVVIAWYSLYALKWGAKDVFFQALLYSTFHFFAILMTHQTRIAELATGKANRLNKELQATHHLLEQATRQNERTRIARDLHDLVGHHLTALIINLQVAGHLADGEAKAKIVQCHSLAKLLLSDVRDAVSTMRENSSLNFAQLVELMIEKIPQLKITRKIDTELNLDDITLAKTLLSCIQEAITNSLRHAGASEFWIDMRREDDSLLVELYDNGEVSADFVKGNGLKGMQERISELSGSINFERLQKSLLIKIRIPFAAANSAAHLKTQSQTIKNQNSTNPLPIVAPQKHSTTVSVAEKQA